MLYNGGTDQLSLAIIYCQYTTYKLKKSKKVHILKIVTHAQSQKQSIE